MLCMNFFFFFFGGGVRNTHLLTKFIALYGHGLWCPKTITLVTSKIKDHKSP